MRVYGDGFSGNCLKIVWVARALDLEFEWTHVSVDKSETRAPEFLAINPAGQVPVVVFDDGRVLSQSNAVIRFLARGSRFLPDDPWTQAKVDEWLFWEQYSHEPYIAVARFWMALKGKRAEELEEKLFARGNFALDLMERHLAGRAWFVGDNATIADIALVAYTRVCHEGGFSLAGRPNLVRWIAACEADFVTPAPEADAAFAAGKAA